VNKPHHKGVPSSHPKTPPNPLVEVTFVFRDAVNHPIEGLAVQIKAGTGAPPAPAWKTGLDVDDSGLSPGYAAGVVAASAGVINSIQGVTDKDGYGVTIHNAARNQPIDVLVKNRRGDYVLKGTVTPSKDVSAYTVISPEYHLEAVTQLAPKDAFEQDLKIPVVKEGEVMTVERLVNEFGPYLGWVQKITEQGKVKKDFPTKKKETYTDVATGKSKTSITIEHHYKVVDTGKPRTIALNVLGSRLNYPNPLKISEQKFVSLATQLGCEVAAVKAVVETESSGAGFCSNGLPKILFERHYFYRASLPEHKRAEPIWRKQPNPFPKVPDLCWKASGGYSVGKPNDTGGWLHSDEGVMYQYQRMIRASKLNLDAALMACSWGAFQVMGYFYKECGYATPTALANSAAKGIDGQVDLFFAYVKHVSAGALPALRDKNWTLFAQSYNGFHCPPSYAKSMKENYEKYS